jgi:GxxExxY protein
MRREVEEMAVIVTSEAEDRIGRHIVDAAYHVHAALGPGLLEAVYEECFCHELRKKGLGFQRQAKLPLVYDGVRLDLALELDVLVEDIVICELKARAAHPVDLAQILSHLKLAGRHLGYLINFHVPLIRDGLRRVVA